MVSFGWVFVIAVVSMLAGFFLGLRVAGNRPEMEPGKPDVASRIPEVVPKPETAVRTEPPKPVKPVLNVEDEFEKIAVAIALAAFSSGK